MNVLTILIVVIILQYIHKKKHKFIQFGKYPQDKMELWVQLII